MEGKMFYSGKDHIYWYKVEVSVSLFSFAVHVSKQYPNSGADATIFCKKT